MSATLELVHNNPEFAIGENRNGHSMRLNSQRLLHIGLVHI